MTQETTPSDQRAQRGATPGPENEWAICALCVDDDPDVIELTSSFLERVNDRITTRTVTSASEALDELETGTVDCVVSDYQMPGMDGLALLDRVRDEYGDLPFVLFTGKGSDEIAEQAISRGATDYLQKEPGVDQYTVLANCVENAVVRHRAEMRFEAFLESVPDGMLIVDREGRIRRVNSVLEAQFGYDRDELLGEPVELLIPECHRERHVAVRERYTASPHPRPMGSGLDLQGRRKDGSEFLVDIRLSPVDLDSQQEVVASVRDVSQRREREREIARLNRINRTLRETAQAVSTADTREEMEQAVCKVLARSEPYRFAWVGERDLATDEVVPRAASGVEDGYLDAVSIAVDEGPSSRGPTATAIRTGTVQTMQNIRTDPKYEPWREEALERGYESSAAIPIANDDHQYGVLNVYAARPGAFDETERRLLAELGETVATAIAGIDARRELQARKEEYEQLIGRISDAYYAVDTEWRVTYWNERMAERTGTPATAVLGANLWEVFPEALGTELGPRYREAMETQEPSSFETYLDEPFEYWVEVDVYPDEDGLSIFSREITERKEREEEFELAEVLFENTQDALFLVDVEGDGDEFRLERVNPAYERHTGLSNDDLSGRTLEEVFGEAEGADILANYRRCVDRREPLEYEERLSVPEEGTYWETRIAPVVVDGTVERLVGATRDITDRREYEHELERQNERLEEFASVVSHDLRNPLLVAHGSLELARESCAPADFDRIEAALGRMETLIDDLLTLAREGQQVEETEPVTVDALVEAAWETVPDDHASLVVDLDDYRIEADETGLRQLLENLLSNAVRHAGDAVTIRVGPLDDGPGFYVADDGAGIPPSRREAVFDHGYSTADGTGLGLSIVRGIARAHGWTVEVTESADGGARFEVRDVERVS